MSPSDLPPKSRPGRRRRDTVDDDKSPETGWFANHPASRMESKADSKRPQGRSPSGTDPKTFSKHMAVTPIVVRGDAPSEQVLVSIVTHSQEALGYTHAFVSAYCQRRFRAVVAQALTLAAHELLENAMSYRSVSKPVLFEIVEKQGSAAAIRVTNETTLARVDMLRSHIEKMAVKGETVMLDEMKRTMGMRHGKAMLGLARIVHEAGLGLELYVMHERVTVLARAQT